MNILAQIRIFGLSLVGPDDSKFIFRTKNRSKQTYITLESKTSESKKIQKLVNKKEGQITTSYIE